MSYHEDLVHHFEALEERLLLKDDFVGGLEGSGKIVVDDSVPALPSFVSLARAREGQAVVPLLRGRSPTRSVAPKPLRGLGRASLRHFGLVLFIP
jgi:hypothetical protein